MTKKKKKGSWKERRRRATLKRQKALDAERLRREPKKSKRWSKGKIFGVALMFLLIIGIYGGWQYTRPANIEEPVHGPEAPLFTLTDIDGNVVALKNLRGKAVLLNFFSPDPEYQGCGAQMVYLEEIYREYDRDEVEIMSISINESAIEDLQEFRTGPNNFSDLVYEMSWIIARDTETEDVIGKYYIEGLPTTVIIDQEGNFSRRNPFLGITKAKTLSQEIHYLLGS